MHKSRWRLRQLRAVAVERVRFQAELPGQDISGLAVGDRRLVRHVDGLGDGAGDERLRRRQHADMALDREIALAGAAARIGAVEHGVVLGLQMRRALDRHGAADMDVGRLDLALGEAEMREQIEARRGEIGRLDLERVAQEIGTQRPLVEGELDVEGGGQRLFHLLDRLRRKAFGRQGRGIDRRRVAERAVADGIGDDLGDLVLGVAEHAQRLRHRAVDDLEVAAAGEFFDRRGGRPARGGDAAGQDGGQRPDRARLPWRGSTTIRGGTRTLELSAVAALTFYLDVDIAINAVGRLAQAVTDAASLEEANDALHELGVSTELDYERDLNAAR